MTMAYLPPGARGIRLGDKPTISVVIASCRDPQLLATCLASLHPQCLQHRAEIVVARAGRPGELKPLAERFPAVRWVPADPEMGVAQLRGLGLAAAQGDIVALTEDDSVVGPCWLGQLLEGAGWGSGGGGEPLADAPRDPVVEQVR